MPTDAEIDAVFSELPNGIDGWLNNWGYRQFARALLAKCAAHIEPLTVSLSPEPRGIHVAVHQPSAYVHAEAMVLPGVEAVRHAALDEAIAVLQPLLLEALKKRLPGDDLDENDEHFDIGQCAQAVGIMYCQAAIRALEASVESS